MSAYTATLPAQAAAGADATVIAGTIHTTADQENAVQRVIITPPPGFVTVTGQATNNATVICRQMRAGAPIGGLTPPTGFTATPVVGGGTFAAGTFFWKITALTAAGETNGSAEATAAIVLNGSANLAWTAVPGATGYKIYRSTATGGSSVSPSLVTTVVSGATVAFTDTGAATTAGAVPATNLTTAFATLTTAAGVNLTAETPVPMTLVGVSGQGGVAAGPVRLQFAQDDVLDVVLHQNGTGQAIGAGVQVEVELTGNESGGSGQIGGGDGRPIGSH